MKLLYTTVTNSLHKYPRLDDEPVVGLSADFEVYDLQILTDPTDIDQIGSTIAGAGLKIHLRGRWDE
jgi:hypothetical protein